MIDVGAQVQQKCNVECKQLFFEPIELRISFSVGGAPQQQLLLKLPVAFNKFFEPTTMGASDFFMRWKQLQAPAQETQNIFTAKYPIDIATVSEKVN